MKRSNGLPLRAAQTIARGTPIASAPNLRQQHQLDRYRQPLGNRLQHRLPGAERAAEIALQHIAEPAQIAPPDRLIQPHVAPQRRHVLRRRLVTEDGVGKIARQQRRDGERQQRNRNQHRQQIEEPARDEERHGRLFLPGARYVDHPAVHLGQALHLRARDRVVGVLEGPEPDRLLVDQPGDRAIVVDALVLVSAVMRA